MKDVLLQVENGNILTTSLLVAEKFNKDHKNVIQKIEALIIEIEDGLKLSSPNDDGSEVDAKLRSPNNENLTDVKLRPLDLFKKSTYVNSQNKTQPMYRMNRDGFSLLAMGFTGKEALKWKLKYIEAFNAMEEMLCSTPQQLPDNRLEIAKIITKTPVHNVAAIRELYPEYFSSAPVVGSLEYRSDLNSGYKKWLEDMNITKAWITHFPTTEIFLNYANYCKDYHIPSMGKKTFFKTLEEDFGMTRSQRHDGYRYFN